MNNNFQKWKILNDLPSKVFFEAVHEDYEGFRVILAESQDEKRLLRVKFEQTLAYSKLEDGCLQDSVPLSMRKEGCLFFATKSSWIDKLHNESHGVYKDLDVKHYVISAVEASLEILSVLDPEVVWLHE